MHAIVRPIESADISHLLRLLRAKAVFDGVEHTLQATEQNLTEELLAPNASARAIVAVVNNQVVGMATYFQTFSSFLMKPGIWLDDLFIEETHRKHGIGRQLIAWLCKEAKANGCARIDWIVAANNDNGRGFYERMGATVFESVRLARIDQNAILAHTSDA